MLRAREKFSRATNELACGQGIIQERLAKAGYHIGGLVDRDIPEELLDNFRELLGELTRVPSAELGSIRATAESLNAEESSYLAGRIVHFFAELLMLIGTRLGSAQAIRELEDLPELGQGDN